MSLETLIPFIKEAFLDNRNAFCKIRFGEKYLFGTIRLQEMFGQGFLIIPVNDTSLARFNSPKLPSEVSPIQHFQSLGFNQKKYGEIQLSSMVLKNKTIFNLLFKRRMLNSDLSFRLGQEALSRNTFIEESLTNIIDCFNENLPKTLVSLLPTSEYPGIYNGHVY